MSHDIDLARKLLASLEAREEEVGAEYARAEQALDRAVEAEARWSAVWDELESAVAECFSRMYPHEPSRSWLTSRVEPWVSIESLIHSKRRGL